MKFFLDTGCGVVDIISKPIKDDDYFESYQGISIKYILSSEHCAAYLFNDSDSG